MSGLGDYEPVNAQTLEGAHRQLDHLRQVIWCLARQQGGLVLVQMHEYIERPRQQAQFGWHTSPVDGALEITATL